MQYLRVLAKCSRRIDTIAALCKSAGVKVNKGGFIHLFHTQGAIHVYRDANFAHNPVMPVPESRCFIPRDSLDISKEYRNYRLMSSVGKKSGCSGTTPNFGGLEQNELSLKDKFVSCSRLMRCHTLVPVVIIGIPVMWSAALALPSVVTLVEIKKIGLLALGTFFTRFAGCCVNDLADAKIDRHVARTKSRPLAAREITYKDAIITLALNSSIALGILLQFDMNTIRLGCLGALMASVYPFLKRFTNYPQVFLGASLGVGTLMAWTSISMSPITLAPLCIYGTACMWTVIYDTVYAHQDKEYDKYIGVKSLAIHWGNDTRKMCKIMAYNMTLLMAACGYLSDLSAPFYLSTVLSHIWMEREINRVNLNDPVDCLGFFKRNTIYGGILLAGILAGKGSLEISLDPHLSNNADLVVEDLH